MFHELRTTVGTGEIQLEATKLGDVAVWLTTEYPTLKEVLFDEKGKPRSYALYYVNNKLVNPVDLQRQLAEGDIVLVVPPAAGG
jgi:molybdopterin converting factor small subunit